MRQGGPRDETIILRAFCVVWDKDYYTEAKEADTRYGDFNGPMQFDMQTLFRQ